MDLDFPYTVLIYLFLFGLGVLQFLFLYLHGYRSANPRGAFVAVSLRFAKFLCLFCIVSYVTLFL